MNIAMIGTGGIARRHCHVLGQIDGVEIVGHVSPTAAHREAAAATYGGRAYADVPALLAAESVDAAIITVPPGMHDGIDEVLVERGIPIFVEKPLAADGPTAERIAAAVERSGVIAGVAYHFRALDTLDRVRQSLADNPARMVIGQWHGGTPGVTWWRHQSTSGGQMVEQATHLVDLARYLVGEGSVQGAAAAHHPHATYDDIDVADVTAGVVTFESGAVGVFSTTCALNHSPSVQLQLVCQGLLITITQRAVTFDYGSETHTYTVGGDPFYAEDLAFIEAVRNGDPSGLYCTYADALESHRLSLALSE